MVDTSILNKQINVLGRVIGVKNQQLTNDSLMFIQKDKVADTWKTSYNEVNLKYVKQSKKTKFYKNTTAILGSTTILLVALFLLVNK